ncbi:uncharacterized protein BO96DRAFT_470611 [Aspergillus niger CBS 101883]|uniref:uncharacterized protein n=1 Tax=Aspergillus lacticoffeatus (strain CBS 101883) TaxID=1450533 RepID=UPI000D7F4293|nr:uncharacterized protein BO96DRAFT_470611 [Aspergillus niger CBS 101883]PYH50650.1 hypothetical protein BO96DRAFT_470611 [Aspergillus niger CBS 101883]
MITLRAVGSPILCWFNLVPVPRYCALLDTKEREKGGWEYPRTSFLTHAYVNRNQLSNNPPSAKPSTRYPASLIPLVGLSTKPHLIRATSTLLFPPFAPPTVGYLDSLEPPTS